MDAESGVSDKIAITFYAWDFAGQVKLIMISSRFIMWLCVYTNKGGILGCSSVFYH